jgi:hypothetical protein
VGGEEAIDPVAYIMDKFHRDYLDYGAGPTRENSRGVHEKESGVPRPGFGPAPGSISGSPPGSLQ